MPPLVLGPAWEYLGGATAAATTIGPVIFSPVYRTIEVVYTIVGYNGGTPIGRILCGNGSISTTAATNGTELDEGVSAVVTTSVSVPGCPLSAVASAIGRHGQFRLSGESGSLKRYTVQGENGNVSVSALPVLFRGGGAFSDLGSNLLIDRVQMSVYDSLTAVALSAQAFTTGSRFDVWGSR